MEHRFTIKDLFLFVLIVVLIVLVALAMKQYDRQWQAIQALNTRSSEQQQELSQIRRLLQQGVRTVGSATTQRSGGSAMAGHDPFDRVRKAQQMPEYAQGDWVIDSGANLEKITPLTSTTYDAYLLQARVLETLAVRHPMTLEWQPHLAESWEIILPPASQPSTTTQATTQPGAATTSTARGAVIKFKLRDNINFSDGTPITPDDWVFTFDLIMNPEIEAPRERSYYSRIESVKKTGEREVTFTFKEPYFLSFEFSAALPVLAKHFYSKFSPKEYNERPGILLGSGPFKLEDPANWSPGKPLQFVRNDRYWGEPAPFDRFVYREIDNELARMTSFRNGDIDYYDKIQPEQFSEMLKDKELVARTQQFNFDSPTRGYRYIAWNQKRGGKPTRFADKRVRQAMTLLTNRERVCNDIMMGYARVATGPFFWKMKQHDQAIKPWPFDPARAKSLLAEAGYKDRDGDGVLDGPDGQPFRFKLTFPSGIANYLRIALFLKDTYAEAGVVLEPDPLDWSVFAERLKNREYEVITLMWAGGIESDAYQIFHSSQMADQGDNHISYSNPDLDRAIEKARTTVDDAARMPLWHEVERIIHEDQPYTFMFTIKQMVFVDKRFKNVEAGGLDLTDIMEWYVPRPQQKWTR